MGEKIRLLLSGLKSVFGYPTAVDEEVEQELQGHIEARAQWFRDAGESNESAWASALEVFGDLESAKAECRLSLLRMRQRASLAASRSLAGAAAMLGVCSIGLGALAVSAISDRSATHQDFLSALEQTEQLENEAASFQATIAQLRIRSTETQQRTVEDSLQALYTVRVHGAVRREGVWLMPRDNPLTVAQLISKIGISADASGEVTVSQSLGPETYRTVKLSRASSDPSTSLHYPLIGACDVHVH